MKYRYKNFQQLMLLRLVRLQKYSHEESGFVLVIVISMVLILTSLLAAYGLLSKIEKASTKSSVSSNTGFYSAEAGLNLRAKKIRDEFNGYNRPSGTAPASWKNCLDTSLPQGTDDFACDKKDNFNGQRLLSYVQENASNPISVRIGTGEDFAGLSAQEYRYDVTSVAVNSQDLPSAILGMRFKSRLVPMFQFVIFYNNDLDFSVPPNMSLNGPIHTNGNLYLNSAASSTLTINGLVSTTGALYRGPKAINLNCSGTVAIYKSPTNTQALACGAGTRTKYTQSNVSDWNNLIRVGIPKLEVPEPEVLDPPNITLSTPGGDYWNKADLRVVLKLDNSGNPSGIEIRNQDNSGDTPKTTALLNSCPTNTTATTTLKNESGTDSNYENDDTVLKVNSTTGFKAGDVVRVGTDYDSNVIASPPTADTITLKRRLGHTYQPTTIASTGNTVSKMSVSTSDTFYNYREKNASPAVGSNGSYIRMLNVDVQSLLDCVQANSLMGSKLLNDDTENGLVWFLTVDGPKSRIDVNSAGTPANTHNDYAIRLYNGKYLYSGQSGAPEIQGLTIVSDQAVYIQGDYNLKDNSATTGTNEGDNPATTGVTERWRPASVLADTINILSNSWKMDDSNGRTYASNVPSSTILLTSSLRASTETTVNAAFLSGTTITGNINGSGGHDGVNSGGVNNYPRFHENWSGIPFNYKGSFVSLNVPRRTNSPFCGSDNTSTCNIYSAPNRNWDFDTDFNDAANLPPMAPQFVYLRQEVFSRNFKQ